MRGFYDGLAHQGGASQIMFHARTIAPIALSAILVAGGAILPALAITGPFTVSDAHDAYAIAGISSGGSGVKGYTNDNAPAGYFAGVAGYDTTTAHNQIGVMGVSHNVGVYGEGNRGFGVYGDAGGASSVAIFGRTMSGGFGVIGTAEGSTSVGVLGETDGTSMPMAAYSSALGHDIMSLDPSGNMRLTGTITTSITAAVVERSAAGPAHVAYSTESTAPAIEDTGEGRIAGGTGYVAIDPALSQTLDARVPYQVLITPEGDSRGLYVTAKSPRGFLVRESQNGRSTLTFAYRIVGKPASENAPRLPLFTMGSAQHARPPVPQIAPSGARR